jgi:hypothetical protein
MEAGRDQHGVDMSDLGLPRKRALHASADLPEAEFRLDAQRGGIIGEDARADEP